jgi:hypothetical protein
MFYICCLYILLVAQVDSSMEYYKMNKPYGVSGDEYKFADSVDDSGDSWQHNYK